MKLRKAKLSDSNFFLEIREHPDNRMMFLSYKKIKKSHHKKWFIKHYKHGFYVITVGNERIGYIRITPINTISIAVKKEFRNKGYAKKAINRLKEKNLYAFILKNNKASLNLFKKTRFKEHNTRLFSR